ncbi:hypothetical protein HNO88_003845 [Novosphingobium chloroacetimidivorans]|uniref:DUF3667 domain-containing protein n=1 Tax=Novosphingobium chloroacetimidivorans TaxID=1428314 RepID=A0A7W7KCZ5_9SPHN|nr:DUF3667 domain-containing protein [Novosphingobium chloroacetimidivorans]MBB4860501.1 hypothetical protein [Novosphingobium chloroacetimidivorans]
MLILRRTAKAIRRATAPETAFIPDGPADLAWSDLAHCRNCGSPLDTPYCGSCGQKAARRLTWRAFIHETWERVRVFELQMLTTATRLLLSPGTVAREYVLGRRSANMHPLKLLVALVAVLVLMLAANRYFSRYAFTGDEVVNRMAERVMLYANWSFSLGIFAIFLGSWTVLRRRLGYNLVEHATLAIYCQSVTLGLVIINLLPTMIWRDPQFVMWHKAASQYYMFAIKFAVVAAGYKQFFLLDLRSEWARWLGALVVYAVTGWLLLRAYALAILWLVT